MIVFASCKPWHKKSCHSFTRVHHGACEYIENPEELTECVRNHFESIKYIFFLHWSWHVPKEIWDNFECICFHMTDVPYGRGGSPLQNLIIAGHKNTKLTALQMVEQMDAGPVYGKRDLSLAGSAQEIYERAGRLSFEMIQWIISEKPKPIQQVGDPTIFKRRKPAQSELPTEPKKLEFIYDYIRMLDAKTYPHAFIEYGNMTISFTDAKLLGSNELVAKVKIKLNQKNEK